MKHKTKMTVAVLSTSIMLSGCTPIDKTIASVDEYAQGKLASISVPFEWFKLDKMKDETPKDVWEDIAPIELPVKDTSNKTRASMEEFLSVLSTELTAVDSMKQFAEGSNTSRETIPYFSYLSSSSDVFGDALKEIYAVPHQFVQSMTLTGVGEQVSDGERMRVMTATLNSVNDSEKFLTHDFSFWMDEKNNVIKVTLNQESNRIHTPKPLTKDSEWVEHVHKEFGFLLKDIRSFPKSEDWTKVTKDVFSSWLTQQGIDDKESVEVMYEWYRMNEGDLSRADVTGYLHTDHEALAQTLYEVTYPHKNTGKTTSFTVVYDRGLNKIIGLQKGSPFTYKGESE